MKALSIRQPWAWLILHAGKNVENRDWAPFNPGLSYRGVFLIHAALKLEPIDDELRAFVRHQCNLDIPPADDLPRGGIVGQAEITGITRESTSPWFFGPYGLLLVNAQVLPFTPCKGMLGFFTPPTSSAN